MATDREQSQRLKQLALRYHREHQGKVEIFSKTKVTNADELSLAYTPGVAEPCRAIAANRELAYEYTAKSNLVAVVTDGTAVLGLGNIGPEAAMPVMEGKAVLMKGFAGVDGFPICLSTTSVDEIVRIVKALTPTFGAINLEDISAPRCFAIEQTLKKQTDIPIFHDDQHGTAIVTLAALINALKVQGREAADVKVVINGAGAAGIAVAKLLLDFGVADIILCDSRGAIYQGRTEGMNPFKEEIARITNRAGKKGSLAEVIGGTDVFIGLSVAGAVTTDMVQSMNADPIIMAMANPVPEIYPDDARQAGAKIICTGRSDFPNQINNVLAFPGVLRGALDVRATDINDEMKAAAAFAIAGLVPESELKADFIIPLPWNDAVAPAVAAAVAGAAIKSGVARIALDPEQVAENTRQRVARVAELSKRGV